MLKKTIKLLLVLLMVCAIISATGKKSVRFVPGGGSSGGAGASGSWKTVSLGEAVLNLSKNELPRWPRISGPTGTYWLGSCLVQPSRKLGWAESGSVYLRLEPGRCTLLDANQEGIRFRRPRMGIPVIRWKRFLSDLFWGRLFRTNHTTWNATTYRHLFRLLCCLLILDHSSVLSIIPPFYI